MADNPVAAEGSESSESIQLVSIPAVTEQDKETGAQAVNNFNKKDYESSLKALRSLVQVRPNDPKVIHNKAVAEYCQAGYTKTDEFKQTLAQVCSMYSQVNIDNIDTLDDVDQCVLYYNHAVILYYLRQYQEAVTVTDKLFQFMEPLEESLSKKVMLFLVELYLDTHQAEKAMAMILYAEKNLLGNGNKSQNSGDKNSDTTATVNDPLRTQISQYKIRCHIMLKAMKPCKREVKSLMNTVGMVTSVIYLKSYFEYLRGNLRKAIKLLNSVTSSSGVTNGQCLSVMYYNNMACLHFQLRKHNLGAFYLRRAIQENTNAIKELPKIDPTKSLSGRPLQSLGVSCHYELLYNMGIELLHCGKAQAAFDCLIEVVQIYQTNPRLWLRVAECCIMAHRNNNEADKDLDERLKVVNGSVGSGIHRKLLLGSERKTNNSSSHLPAMPAPTLPFAALCLKNADCLIHTAMSSQLQPQSEGEPTEPVKPAMGVHAEPGNPLRPQEVANLRCSVLANSAYVSLCLNDYLTALHHAENLLKQPKLSGAHKYLGHMYMAEALLKLDRIADAIQNLVPDSVTDVSTLPPEHRIDSTSEKDSQESSDWTAQSYPWYPKELARAKAILQYNLACAHAIRGEFDKALNNLDQSSQNIGQPLPAQAYFLRLYLDLIEGRKKTAQGIIKEHFGHVTLNRYATQFPS